MRSTLLTATRALLVLTALTGLAYPLLVSTISGALFADQAKGSLIERDGKIVGSRLVGQPFSGESYFWGRPSATGSRPYNAAASSGANVGPTNPALAERLKASVKALRAAHPSQKGLVPVDLVTTSASGLDPHITPAAAAYQIDRVAAARAMSPDTVRDVVAQATEPRQLGFLGEPRVNVLELNLALDAISGGVPKAAQWCYERLGRPSPERLLQRWSSKRPQERGRLLFLPAGVGKTFAMLQAAHELKGRGVDVVIGWVETHGRKDTEALLGGLERLPPRRLTHRDSELPEFDLDGALARRPRVLLVDELAHSNVPGSRHTKRWQDVEEILGAGIDVFSTLNVQHIESLNDVVARVTGVAVRETVPDAVLERADAVELVDLPPDELIERLQEGKVDLGEQAQRALERFHRRQPPLRELACAPPSATPRCRPGASHEVMKPG
jgi:K+-transporting ATPase KdpC subunit